MSTILVRFESLPSPLPIRDRWHGFFNPISFEVPVGFASDIDADFPTTVRITAVIGGKQNRVVFKFEANDGSANESPFNKHYYVLKMAYGLDRRIAYLERRCGTLSSASKSIKRYSAPTFRRFHIVLPRGNMVPVNGINTQLFVNMKRQPCPLDNLLKAGLYMYHVFIFI